MKNTGVYQLGNGYWEYRIVLKDNGRIVTRRKRKDEFGNALTTKKAAVAARKAEMERMQSDIRRHIQAAPVPRKTVMEVYQEYCENGRSGKAYATIKKQDSLWKNHLCKRYGSRYIDEISVAEIVDYLTHLYYVEGRAYKYVESFLKMFYLIFGQAYSRNYLDVDVYNKLCINKGTRIHMPKKKITEDDDVAAFGKAERECLDNYFIGTNAETAYMLGRYCGLRINECYGLKWCNVNLDMGTIIIDRQMQYQDGLIKLVTLKTRNAKRTIYMCDKLKVYFQKLKHQRDLAETELIGQRQQNQTYITDLDGRMISSLDLVNSLPNGKIQTVNSMKYHSRTIKEKHGINFKFHYLRHTYGTMMAEMNTPMHLLCNQMGHASSKVTQRYYIAVSTNGINILQGNLNML